MLAGRARPNLSPNFQAGDLTKLLSLLAGQPRLTPLRSIAAQLGLGGAVATGRRVLSLSHTSHSTSLRSPAFFSDAGVYHRLPGHRQ